MPSPFPGMDPYIESSGRWGDFHLSFIAAMRAELNRRLPKGYAAEAGLYVWLDDPEADEPKLIEPDVYVADTVHRVPVKRRRIPSAAAPRTVTLPPQVPRRQRYLRVVDRDQNRVVTAIEVLSPSNKYAGKDRERYLAKRNEHLANQVSFVEMDLLRGGPRWPLGTPAFEVRDYYVLVSRPWLYPRADVWTFTVRDPLPAIPIPLDEDVSEVLLPLRPCVDEAYDGGRYGERLPYDRPLTPRLRGPDAAWVKGILKARTSA